MTFKIGNKLITTYKKEELITISNEIAFELNRRKRVFEIKEHMYTYKN